MAPLPSLILFIALGCSALVPSRTLAADCFLQGRVLDESEQAIPGVSVYVESLQKGTATTKEGAFRLAVDHRSERTLRFTAVGYQPKTISIASGSCPDIGDITLIAAVQQLRPLVVTATRNMRSLDGISLPVSVVDQQEIRRRSTQRLGDLLSELGGLNVVNNFGLGLQMQGFDPDYTLIMIDGDPIIGRTAGTLDLNRIAIADVRQIEIVKGPSSSLYGSEALAGVINIITDREGQGLHYEGASTLGSYGFSDSHAQLKIHQEKLSQTLFLNHNRSDGYDLNPSTRWATTSKTWSTSLRSNTQWTASDKLGVRLSVRAYQEDQRNQDAFVTTQRGMADVLYFARQRDASISAEAHYQSKPGLQFTLRNQASYYETNAYYRFESDEAFFDPNVFEQLYLRPEGSLIRSLDKHTISGGLGWMVESVQSDRYIDGLNQQNTAYLYGQHDWEITDRWSMLTGLRYDHPQVYDPKWSPRLSSAYSWDGFTLRAAFGTGFKSPDFRHLYLDFFNAAGAYRVLGSQSAEREIGRLIEQGSLRSEDLYLPLQQLATLKPEQSLALNMGVDLTRKNLRLSTNLFRNKVSDLIEYTRAAQLANGQTIFTYQNINAVRLSGIEWDGLWSINTRVQIGFAYQYLDSRDVEVVRDIKNGRVFRRDPKNGEVSRVSMRDYGGLPNRSRHSANLSITIQNLIKDSDVHLRAIYKGRYGFGDANGNGIIDQDLEYGRSHLMLNGTFLKQVGKHAEIHAKVLNALNSTDSERLLTSPGRQFQIGIRLHK